MLSLNQIINKLKEIQENHDQLNDFRFGNPADYGSEQVIQYNLLGAWLEPGNLQKGKQVTKLRLYVVGIVDIGESDELPNIGMRNDVLSDTQLIIMDVFAKLWEYFNENSILLSPDAELSHIEGAWDDNVYGWTALLEINQFYSRDTCQVPFRGVVPPPTDPYITTSLTLDTGGGQIDLAVNQETALFYFIGEGFTDESGDVTVSMQFEIELWDGSQWLTSAQTLTLPYSNRRLLTEAIYKVRLPQSTGTAILQADSGDLHYQQIFSTTN